MTALTPTQRSQKHRDKLKADGWVCVSVLLPPEAGRRLHDIISLTGETKAEIIARLLNPWSQKS